MCKMQKSVLMFLCTVLLAGLLLPQAAFAQVRPALVKNVDEPGLVPFSQTFQISITACSCQNCCFLTTAPVPAGKRLVITNVSGFFPLASAVNMGPVTVNAVDPSPFNLVQLLALPVIFRTQWNGGDYPAYELNENVQTFVDAGKVVQLAVFHSSNWNFRTGAVTINGYLVSLN